ncbi:hypothetical protein SM124_02295 [Bacillus sp. 31A1R]|uniref:Uncharacterized protein n=1 Tax=Robertmurraya mangrovi TaxID=3098077 RepID=A0ABU5ITV9_9BACI|nr:hypothetical protein [Bacillus sp. 31A1R]MDZ5470571.1 hypothetical protein [Bacillus sp. 31A1R]
MSPEIEKALRVKCIANDILELLMEDQTNFSEMDLRNIVELLARSVNDLTNIYTGLDEDHGTTLKATIAKMRIGYNTLNYGKMKQRLENESV